MFDAQIRPLIDRILNPVGRELAARGVTANHVTIVGMLFGLAAALCVAFQLFNIAFWLILLNRVADGVDGAVARASVDCVLRLVAPPVRRWADIQTNDRAGVTHLLCRPITKERVSPCPAISMSM